MSKMKQPVKGMGGGNKQKWKAQSEQFRAAMRAARGAPSKGNSGTNGYGGGGHESYGGGGAASYEYDDRTPCPYCGRKFNDVAAQRHIPHCQNKAKEQSMRMGPARGGRGGYRR